jgi:hypothetical protein
MLIQSLPYPFVSSLNVATMFSGGEAGVWYDPSDLSSMFQDSAGTVPAVVDSPVGRINDKSGNGKHAVQTIDSARPILRKSGSLYWLEHTRSQYLKAVFTIVQPFSRVSGIRFLTQPGGDERIFSGGTVVSGLLYQFLNDTGLFNGSANGCVNDFATRNVDFVPTERHAGAGSHYAVDNLTPVTGDSGGTTPPGGITIGADPNGAAGANMRFYGAMMIGRTLTNAEIASLRTYYGKAQGRVL